MTREYDGDLPASHLLASPIIVLDNDGHIEMVNQAALHLVQDPIDSRFNRRADNPVEARYLWLAGALEALGDSPEAVFEQEVVTKNGVKQFQVRLSRLITPEGEERARVVILEDVDGQKRFPASSASARGDLSSFSLVDDLTGLHNRRGFSALASHLLKLADQSRRHLAFLVCTIEGMSSTGETNWHEENDRAVVTTADILRDTFRASDIVARVGRGEFAVLAVGSFDGGANDLASRLRQAVDAKSSRGEFDHQLSISVGLIPYDPMYPRTVDELLARIPGSV